MIRLLFRLLVQRFKEYSSKRTIQKLKRSKETQSLKKRTQRFNWAVAGITIFLVLAFIIGNQIRDTSDVLDFNPELAQLTVNFDSVENPPYVVYLDPVEAPLSLVPENTSLSRIIIKDNQFIPTLQLLPAGSTLEIENQDSFLHNAHVLDGENTVFNVATPLESVTVSKILKPTGMLKVLCDLHPSMHSWIFVPANPHYAIAREPNELIWRDILPGTYDLMVWNLGRITHTASINLSPGSKKSITIKR